MNLTRRVVASAVYVSGANSKTVYEASAAADLKEYQLRGVIGEDWDDEDAVTIATNGRVRRGSSRWPSA